MNLRGTRGKLLVKLAKEKGAVSEDDLTSNSERIPSSFQDFESSGSEYLPPSPIAKSESTFESKRSEIVPFTKVIEVEQQSSTSKVLHYLDNLVLGSTEPEQSAVPELLREASFTNETLVNNIVENEVPPSTIKINNEQQYTKKACARERPTICPICYQDVITHFTRHLLRHHKDNKHVMLIKSLKSGSKERLALIATLRKQGYFHLKTEKNVLNPVRSSKNPNTDYFVCTYCLGHYTRKHLYKHVKICKNKPLDEMAAGKNCLTRSQTFMASVTSRNHEFLRASRIKAEVFGIMRPDDISFVAKNDPLISLYGETLLNKHKRQQISIVISNKIREMARLLIAIKSINVNISGLFDTLKPEMFQSFVSATKLISGYDENTKSFKAPSLALHMGTNLKLVCDIAIKLVIEKKNIPNIKWNDRDEKKSEIKDLKKLIEGHWCSELSSLALKVLKEKQWAKPVMLPLTSDIQLFQTYVNKLADDAYDNLNNNVDIRTNYKILTQCVLALTVMFNRKRVGDVQYLKIDIYNTDSSTINQEAFMESLTTVEKLISKKFKRVVAGGKGSKPIPILFSKRIQKFIVSLLKVRKDFNIVPESNSYLFANPGSQNRWMAGVNVIRKLAKSCGAKNPSLLTSTKFRKHIATTLQLMSLEENEMEQIASFMGHTKKTHAEFYRLPQDIYQTAKVAKILLLLEKGKRKEFRGKNLNEIELDTNVYHSSESEDEGENESNPQPLSDYFLNRISNTDVPPSINTAGSSEHLQNECVGNNNLTSQLEQEEQETDRNGLTKKKKTFENKNAGQKQSGRVRWSETEKRLVTNHFRHHIKKKMTPKKHECDELLARHGDVLTNKDWVRIKTLVYNTFRNK